MSHVLESCLCFGEMSVLSIPVTCFVEVDSCLRQCMGVFVPLSLDLRCVLMCEGDECSGLGYHDLYTNSQSSLEGVDPIAA